MKGILFSVKTAWSGVFGVALSLCGGASPTLQALAILLILDFVLGMLIAYQKKSLESYKMRKLQAGGLGKIIAYFVAIIVGNKMDIIFKDQISIFTGVELPMEFVSFRNLILAYLAITELVSILENLTILGVPLPGFLVKRLKVSKEKFDQIV